MRPLAASSSCSTPAPGDSAEPRGFQHRATVFGLDVLSTRPLALLAGASARPSGRRLELSIRADAAALAWPKGADLISDERGRANEVCFRIEADPLAGYLFSGPTYGVHLLTADGRALQCVPAGAPEPVWQRFLLAQVLPFAAVLQGFEVFHASAVALNGSAVCFAGPSRSGKTSLAFELAREDGSFLADDVLALEHRDGRLLAHPGSPLAGIDHDEAARLSGARRAPHALARNEREVLVSLAGARAPLPLAATFFLERRGDGPEQPSFEPIRSAGTLLAGTFNLLVATPERLHRLLETAALIAGLRAETVVFGASVDATQLAGAILRRLERS